MIGMCDSARCPQATHHQAHRPVWAEHAERTKTFLGQLGKTRATERARLQRRLRPRPAGHRQHRHRQHARHQQGPVMRISAAQRIQNENRIRAAMDRYCAARSRPEAATAISRPSHSQPGSTAPPSTATGPTHTCAPNSSTDSSNSSRTAKPRTRNPPRSNDSRPRSTSSETRLAQADSTDRGTHRLPHPGPGPDRRPTRRDPATPRRRSPERHHPPASPTQHKVIGPC